MKHSVPQLMAPLPRLGISWAPVFVHESATRRSNGLGLEVSEGRRQLLAPILRQRRVSSLSDEVIDVFLRLFRPWCSRHRTLDCANQGNEASASRALEVGKAVAVSYTHLRAHETR